MRYFISKIIFFTVISTYIFSEDLRVSSLDQLNYPTMRLNNTVEKYSRLSIDPSVYVLGPGDALEIRTSNMPWVVYSGTVNESNMLYISELGTFNVHKRTFESTKKEISDFMLQRNSNVEINIALSSFKEVEVVINGTAVNSGNYRLNGTLRVLDAIKVALKDSNILFKDLNFRKVGVTIQNQTVYYDLAGFIAYGEGSANPYLYPGSVITVSPATQWITISGAVTGPFPESIPFLEHDHYDRIFKLYNLTSNADTNNIQLFRNDQSPSRHTLSSISRESVRDLDYIVVSTLDQPGKSIQVTIGGEVKSPGVYPLAADHALSIYNIVAMAGGISDRGDSTRSYVVRNDPLATLSKQITNPSGGVSSIKDPHLLKSASSGDYRIIPLTRNSKIQLENNDAIIIPESSHTVYVSGSVKRPGAYLYRAGKSINYYIKCAGGWAKYADRKNTKKVTVYNDNWIVKEGLVEAGDLIVVPESLRNEQAQRYDLLIRTFYYAGTTILAFISIGKALDLIRAE